MQNKIQLEGQFIPNTIIYIHPPVKYCCNICIMLAIILWNFVQTLTVFKQQVDVYRFLALPC